MLYRMRVFLRVLSGTIALLVVARCELADMEYVPNADDIRTRVQLAPFVGSATDVRGIYGNADVDCVVFSYAAKGDTVGTMTRDAMRAGWTRVSNARPAGMRFFRVTHAHPPTGPCGEGGARDGTEEVRVAHDRDRVTVAYVQVDHLHRPECRRGEDKYAEAMLWPRFEEAASR